jgi:hypothetical protein
MHRECFSLSARYLSVIAEGGNAMKIILGALTAVTLLVGVAASQPAEARCFWNGYAMECYHPYHHWWWRHHFYRPYYRDWD